MAALNPGRHARAQVAARFWPDVLDARARASLRSALWALRRSLGAAANRHLLAARDEIELAEADGLWVDVREFEALVAAGRLEEAIAVGDSVLLAGFEDDWVADARAAHTTRLAETLERLAGAAQEAGELDDAVAFTRRQAALDVLDESPHRRLMTRLAATGDRAAALVEYERMRERLRRELGVVPSLTTRRLAERLREDESIGAVQAFGAAGQPPLVGRERELAELRTAWESAADGRGGVALIRGDAGLGKTRLALELAAEAARSGARVASGAGLDLAGAAALGLWADLIGELVRELEAPPLDSGWPAELARLAPDLERRFEPRLSSSVSKYCRTTAVRCDSSNSIFNPVVWHGRRRPVGLLNPGRPSSIRSALTSVNRTTRKYMGSSSTVWLGATVRLPRDSGVTGWATGPEGPNAVASARARCASSAAPRTRRSSRPRSAMSGRQRTNRTVRTDDEPASPVFEHVLAQDLVGTPIADVAFAGSSSTASSSRARSSPLSACPWSRVGAW